MWLISPSPKHRGVDEREDGSRDTDFVGPMNKSQFLSESLDYVHICSSASLVL